MQLSLVSRFSVGFFHVLVLLSQRRQLHGSVVSISSWHLCEFLSPCQITKLYTSSCRFLSGIYLRKSLPLCDDMSVVQPRLEDLLNIVTDMPLKFPELKTASIVIKLMTKCLQDIPYVHPYTPLLGENLVRIIETVLKQRDLNNEEVNSICLMAAHRLE